MLLKALKRGRDADAGFSPDDVERLVLGRGVGAGDKSRRVSVLPLPSIGHDYADGMVRRVLVSVPPGCPIEPEIIRRTVTGG